MDLDFPPNSHISHPTDAPIKEDDKKVTRVVQGDVKRRKKSLGSKFKETFFSDSVESVWDYVLFDVVIPAAKDMISDAVTEGFQRMIFGGDSRPSSRRRGNFRPGGSGYVSYNRYSSPLPRDDPRGRSRRSPARTSSFEDIILPSRAEAEAVIDQMYLLVEKYEQVTVSDLLEMVGLNPKFTDERWGWTDLRGVSARRLNNGYLLDLPRPESL